MIKQYTTVNAFSHTISLEQASTFAFTLLQLIIHSLFILPEIFILEYISTIIFYTLLVIMMIFYTYLLFFDPVDINVKKKRQQTQEMNIFQTYKYCDFCQAIVQLKSKHCKICNRCCSDFDHHCVYLNNCIGGRNYKQFIILVLSTIFFQICFIYQSTRSFANILKNPNENPLYVVGNRQFYKWILIVISFVGLLCLASLVFLLALHIYLSYINLSTYDWLKRNEFKNRGANKIIPAESERKIDQKVNPAESQQQINHNLKANIPESERNIHNK